MAEFGALASYTVYSKVLVSQPTIVKVVTCVLTPKLSGGEVGKEKFYGQYR